MADEPTAHELEHDEDVTVHIGPGAAEGTYGVTVRKAREVVHELPDVPSGELFARLHDTEHVDAVPVALPTSELTPLEPAEQPEVPAPEPEPPAPEPEPEPPAPEPEVSAPEPEPKPEPPAPEPTPPPAPPPASPAENPLLAWLKRLWRRLTGG